MTNFAESRVQSVEKFCVSKLLDAVPHLINSANCNPQKRLGISQERQNLLILAPPTNSSFNEIIYIAIEHCTSISYFVISPKVFY